MQYDFLKNFPQRMKNVGLYATLAGNITSRTKWNEYGFEKNNERINIVFSILLFIMEKSLREEICTIDDITVFIDDINDAYYHKELSYDDCMSLADFIVDVVLSNEGRQMFFDGFDYEQDAYHIMNIRYIRNRIVYSEGDVRRTSYLLTDDGYNLLLSTLEVESNLRISIQEMIFRLHLEKQSYDKAVDDIRNIFHHIRIQYQKIVDAMQRVRKNALDYSVGEYNSIQEEDLDVVAETKNKFEGYRELVSNRVNEFEERNIDAAGLSKEDEEKLKNLKRIGEYLDRTIDEHQKIMSRHMDLKELYTKELESLSQFTRIKRFSLRNDVYDRLLDNPDAIGDLNMIFAPLFRSDTDKIYNTDKAFMPHRLNRKKKEEQTSENIEFDEVLWEAEQKKLREEKRKRYESSLGFIIREVCENGSVTLSAIREKVTGDAELIDMLIPDIDIFKEVMVELLREKHMDIDELKTERGEVISDSDEIFELNYMLLDLLEKYDREGSIKGIFIEKLENSEKVVFENVRTRDGVMRNIRCSDVRIKADGI
ncbi:MAG: hypothetical protein IJT96_05485 [Lachnospiraceae bacterium]|nr:hypothetical protein [Lachnospiraceae bacterium]